MIDMLFKQAPIIAMFLFMAVFFIAATYTYWPRNKARMESYGKIPLKESQDGE